MKETLIQNFLRIAKIPRPSGHEKEIASFFVSIAKKRGFYYFEDSNHNVLIRKKGDSSKEPIALQTHLDMVCVKDEGVTIDFLKEGIDVLIVGDEVRAKGTSLGADQGVGLAIMLTLLEDESLKHPDLEFLFTIEEETTFKGAVTFPYEKVLSKRMINLDNCKDDSIFVGSEGDICNKYSYKGTFVQNNLPAYLVRIDDFPGGNSGEEVILSLNSAIPTMARLLEGKDIFLKRIVGGTSENDLATFCEVEIHTSLDVSTLFGENAKIKCISSSISFTKEDTDNILKEILSLKGGPLLEDGSANLGVVQTKNESIELYYVLRSMDKEKLETYNQESKTLPNGFLVTEVYRDPIWKVNTESKLLSLYKETYYKKYSCYPKEEIWCGAIECATIKSKIDGLDIISIGGIIKKFHTLSEVTYISSWFKIYTLLAEFLERL